MSKASFLLNGKPSSQNVCFTLPISCQICLGKVKEPSICPNLHVFCSKCIDTWLEKTKQCPTCRVPIDKDNPCRRILGGIDNEDDTDLIKPTEFSNPVTRKARFMYLFDQYEEEVTRLNNFIDCLNDEISKLRESGSSSVQIEPGSCKDEIMQQMKLKIDNLQKSNEELVKERDEYKEENKKLDSENSILIQDIARLRASLNEKNSQITSKYTMAALESKIESYEKEIKQLQKALEKSDKYIFDLESKKDFKDKENKLNSHSSDEKYSFNNIPSTSSVFNFKSETNKSENLTQNKSDLQCLLSSVTSPPSSSQMGNPPSAKKVNVIPKVNFYGSPSKTPTRSNTNHASTQPVSSFGERLKKNLFNTPSKKDFELLNQLSQGNNSNSSSVLFSNSTNSNPSGNQNFLFSPMKRLRIEEPEHQEKINSHSFVNISDQSVSNSNENEGTKIYATLTPMKESTFLPPIDPNNFINQMGSSVNCSNSSSNNLFFSS
ncbi:unnamed protein product [Brachionus calyciflorus]|uniref:RING-type domain-containing protein n=1 Tax=Brachionus calyciflorus TaxID=104777 RepID=A0A813N7X3_9BILA|nr:unnamed protein product [Brachionus calyciflorus]